ncbi:MAG: demethoxyubiquinone hydroxylase family protein, partial [Stellaceae bacterium]
IDEHYARQAERIGDSDPALRDTICEFRDDELRHRQAALDHGAAEALGYDALAAAIKTGSRLAIWLSTRL